jgi:hypothetical protein
LHTHLQVERYGTFTLTRAIRPAPHLPIIPRQGYRKEIFRDRRFRKQIPMLAAAVSREQLFEVFLSLLEPLGDEVDVILETSHHDDFGDHQDLIRQGIERSILCSYLYEFEDLLLDDGCTGVAVISGCGKMEVQFDEHKQLVIYAKQLGPFERILREAGVERDDTLRLLSEAEHLHASDDDSADRFEILCQMIGVFEPVEAGW